MKAGRRLHTALVVIWVGLLQVTPATSDWSRNQEILHFEQETMKSNPSSIQLLREIEATCGKGLVRVGVETSRSVLARILGSCRIAPPSDSTTQTSPEPGG